MIYLIPFTSPFNSKYLLLSAGDRAQGCLHGRQAFHHSASLKAFKPYNQLPGVTVKPYHSQVRCHTPTVPATPEGLKQEDRFSPVQNHPKQHCNTLAQGKETKLNITARSRPILYNNCPRLNKMFQELGIQLTAGSTGDPGFSKKVLPTPSSEFQPRSQPLSLVLIYLLFLSNL